MTPEHVFRVASHSKMFTATAVMQLVEHGKLRLDDRAAAYVTWL
jgi:CubicO group peptidase (beta-lactamase class C family)